MKKINPLIYQLCSYHVAQSFDSQLDKWLWLHREKRDVLRKKKNAIFYVAVLMSGICQPRFESF